MDAETPSPDELRELTGYDSPALTNAELVKRHFDEAQYRCAEAITAMATGTVERDATRLKAAIFVIEFNHGPVSRSQGALDPWNEGLKRLTKTDGKGRDDSP